MAYKRCNSALKTEESYVVLCKVPELHMKISTESKRSKTDHLLGTWARHHPRRPSHTLTNIDCCPGSRGKLIPYLHSLPDETGLKPAYRVHFSSDSYSPPLKPPAISIELWFSSLRFIHIQPAQLLTTKYLGLFTAPMFAARAFGRQARVLPRWTQFRCVSTLEGSPYIVCDCCTLKSSHWS